VKYRNIQLPTTYVQLQCDCEVLHFCFNTNYDGLFKTIMESEYFFTSELTEDIFEENEPIKTEPSNLENIESTESADCKNSRQGLQNHLQNPTEGTSFSISLQSDHFDQKIQSEKSSKKRVLASTKRSFNCEFCNKQLSSKKRLEKAQRC